MTASTDKDRAKLWTIMAIVATVAGLIWIGWAKRPLPIERRNTAVSLPSGDEPEKNRRGEAGDEATPRLSQPASQEERIERLLEFVEHSDVVFIRNGSEYSGAQAAAHLRDKLRGSGLREPTLDEFIEKIASRSSVTGRLYQVRLTDGTTVDAGLWLRLQCNTTSSNVDKAPSREGQ